MGESISANGTELWVERSGQGPEVLLIAGLGDPAEAWQPQLDGLASYRVTAFDNQIGVATFSSCHGVLTRLPIKQLAIQSATATPRQSSSRPGPALGMLTILTPTSRQMSRHTPFSTHSKRSVRCRVAPGFQSVL